MMMEESQDMGWLRIGGEEIHGRSANEAEERWDGSVVRSGVDGPGRKAIP